MMVAAFGGGLIGWTLAARRARGAERDEVPVADLRPAGRPVLVRPADVPPLAPLVDFDVRTPAQQ